MSLTGTSCLLWLFLLVNESSYATRDSITCCPSVSKSRSSTHVPTETAGRNYTIWQEFVITLPSSSCNTSDISSRLNATWTRSPYDIDHRTSSEELSIQKGKSDLELLANASLTLFNLSYWKDSDQYFVNLTVKQCSGVFAVSNFTLKVLPKCTSDVPSPAKVSLVVSTPAWVPCPKINMSFIGGDPKLPFYNMEWKNSRGSTLCFSSTEVSKQGRYRCDWVCEDYASCNTSAWLKIADCTPQDSGHYTVQAVGQDPPSTPANITLLVIPRPEVYIVPYSKTSDIRKYTIDNYSKDFIVITFLRDDKEFKNNSDPGYFTITELDTPSTVQVVLHIHLSGTYRLCYEFTNFSDPVYNGGRNCTMGLTVKITEGSELPLTTIILASVFLVIISIMVVVLFVILVKCWYKTSKSPLYKPMTSYGAVGSFGTAEPIVTAYYDSDRESEDMDTEGALVRNGDNHTQDIDSEEDSSHAIWKMMSPSHLLKKEYLVHIAKVIPYWKELARHLGLEEAEIVTIQQNYVSDYEEQKIQMLLKWYQQQHSPPSCQRLVRIIEEKMQDHKLAKRVESTLFHLHEKEQQRPRFNTIV